MTTIHARQIRFKKMHVMKTKKVNMKTERSVEVENGGRGTKIKEITKGEKDGKEMDKKLE